MTVKISDSITNGSAAAPISPTDFSLLSPEVRTDPYPYYTVLRNQSPIHPLVPGTSSYAITRFEDVSSVLHNPEAFSSTALQSALQGGGTNTGPNSGALAGHPLIEAPMMIAVDPPDHGRLRRLVNRGFTPRRIAEMEERIRELAVGFLEPHLASGSIDLTQDLAIPLPVTVIAELLGIEPDRIADFKRWSDTTVIGLSGVAGEYDSETIRAAADEMVDYIDRIAAERRKRPRNDLISVLVQAEEGDTLTTSEVMSFTLLLLLAGNETTTNLIGNAAAALLKSPDQLERVYAQPSCIPEMIEEVVRYDSPIQALPRQATADFELPSGRIEKDAFLLVYFASANRDERKFEAPDRFDIGRDTSDHIGFGHGVHFCLGAALARLEGRVAFEVLVDRCANLRFATDRIEVIDSMVLRGPKSLPLAFTC